MQSERGVTLVELVLVIVLLGILAVVVAPRLDRRGFDTAAAATELVQAIRYAQAQSMAQGAGQAYAVELAAGGYRVICTPKESSQQCPTGLPVSAGWSGMAIAPIGTISFDARGQPHCSGFDCSMQTQQISISRGSSSQVVSLEPVTGYVR